MWTNISGYMNACLKALANDGVEIFLVMYEPSSAAPFSCELLNWLPSDNKILIPEGSQLGREKLDCINKFEPNLLICAGWSNYQYIKIARKFSTNCAKIITFDTQHLSTFKQFLGRVWFKISLLKIFNYAFVPGDRQFRAAIYFGFKEKNIVMGSYAPDNCHQFTPDFKSVSKNKKFIFVGRLVPEKGVNYLMQAYSLYRKKTDSPWRLAIAGVGPLSYKLLGEGVELLGFLSPDRLFDEMKSASCLVAPSLFEPWGVQISEGVSFGLPVIATTACGSSVHLVRSHFNGYLVAPGDVDGLCQAMLDISNTDDLEEFSRNSYSLSGQYTPSIWSKSIIRTYLRFINSLES